MEYTAALAQTATGDHKSKILSKGYAQLVITMDIPSEEFAKLLDTYQEKQFLVEIKPITKERMVGLNAKRS